MRAEVRETVMASCARKARTAMRHNFMQYSCSASEQISHLGQCRTKKCLSMPQLTQWQTESLIFFMYWQNLETDQPGPWGWREKSCWMSLPDLFFLNRKDIIWFTRLGTMLRLSFVHSMRKSSFTQEPAQTEKGVAFQVSLLDGGGREAREEEGGVCSSWVSVLSETSWSFSGQCMYVETGEMSILLSMSGCLVSSFIDSACVCGVCVWGRKQRKAMGVGSVSGVSWQQYQMDGGVPLEQEGV